MFSPNTEAKEVERQLYLYSLHELVRRPAFEAAVSLLSGWSGNAKGRNVASAACHYLTHNVIPMLQEGGTPSDWIPVWVDRALFHPPLQSVSNVSEWLSLFPGTACEGLYERTKGFGGHFGTNIPNELINELKTKNIGLYFCPNGNTGKRNTENTNRLNACFADFDDGSKEEQMDLIRSLPLKPSAVVESGRGYHVYWLFEYPETDKELWRRVQKTIAKVCKSDPKICNPDRLMRLPFSWHTKTDDKRLVQVVEYTSVRYTMADVEVAFPPEPIPRYVAMTDRPRDLRIPELTTLTPNQRHGSLLEETARVYANLPQGKAAAARAGIKYWYFHSSKPPKAWWESEADAVCDDIERREYGSVVSR